MGRYRRGEYRPPTPEQARASLRPKHTGIPRLPGPTALRVWMAKNPEASAKEISDMLGVHSTSFLYWKNGRRNCSPLHAAQIEQLTHGEVPRHLWTPPTSKISRAAKAERISHAKQLAPGRVYGEITTHVEPQSGVIPIDAATRREIMLKERKVS